MTGTRAARRARSAVGAGGSRASPGDAQTGKLRTGELARAAGVRRQTLRYYERRGLLAEPERSPGGHRLYPAEAVTGLRAIKTAQRLGFSLAQIAELLPSRPATGCASLASLVTARLAGVEAQIAELQATAATLRAAHQAGCTTLADCARQPGCPLPFGPA